MGIRKAQRASGDDIDWEADAASKINRPPSPKAPFSPGGGVVVLFYTGIHRGIGNLTLGFYVRRGFLCVAYTLLSSLAISRNGIST